MSRVFVPLVLVALVMFAAAPFVVAYAPFEQTMGLVQKIFYYHVPSAMMMFISAFVCGIASAVYLFRKFGAADRLALAAGELVVLFGAIVMVTGPLWGRKAWGVWWQWDAKLTSALLLWMIFIGVPAGAPLRRPGFREARAAPWRCSEWPTSRSCTSSVNYWRTLHPRRAWCMTLAPGMRGAFWFCVLRSRCCTCCC